MRQEIDMEQNLRDYLADPRRSENFAAEPSPLFSKLKAVAEQTDRPTQSAMVSNFVGTKKATDVGDISGLSLGQQPEILSTQGNDDSTTSQSDTLTAAVTYLRCGLSVIPIKPDEKTAATPWKPYQTRRMTEEEAGRLFQAGQNIALIGGAVSGHLECLDFDEPSLFPIFLETLAAINPALRDKLTVWQDTPSGGFHLLYHCTGPVGGSQKLAMTADGQTAIETRAEGGYFFVRTISDQWQELRAPWQHRSPSSADAGGT